MTGNNWTTFLVVALFVFCALLTPSAAALDVVATTSVLADPFQAIGGEHVEAIAVADPAICPHMQGDIIDNRIQMQKDFIASADLFVAHDSSMDKPVVMPAIEKFIDANDYGTVDWTVVETEYWNTPENAKVLAAEVRSILAEVDPENATAYEANYESYCEAIDATDLTEEEAARINGQDVIVMAWQKNPVENWLGLNVVAVFGPEFYMEGKFTPAKVVDDINADPEKYQNVKYVIENMQSGEMAKGIEEALHDQGIRAERVIFTNFPMSITDVKSIPDVLVHNKEAITPPDRPMTIVATTSVISDPFQAIGGEHVEAIAVADPTICPHMQGDIIDSRIQMQKDLIASADLFVAHDSSMDKPVVMPAIEKFMDANDYGTVGWTVMEVQDWNTPEKAILFAKNVRDILSNAQPWHADEFEENFQTYCDAIDEADIAASERERIEGQDVVVMAWQKDPTENWLGLNVVAVFGPEFYMQGKFTPAKIVDDINANPEKYLNVKYVIENMQSGEMAKGIEEALNDQGVQAERVIFTNFPMSIAGVESIPDVLAHNKEAVMAPARKYSESDDDWEAPAAQLGAGEENEFCFEGCAVSRIALIPEGAIGSLILTAKEVASLPGEIEPPENTTYRYLAITPSSESVQENCEAWIEFSVGESWLTEKGIEPLDIVMIHYHDGAWQILDTEYLGTTNGVAIYRARCTGFSYFAITVLPGGATFAETTASHQTIETNESTESNSIVTTTKPQAQAAVPTETTASSTAAPPQTTPQQSPIGPVFFFALAAVVFGLMRRI
ncbi:PGF-pre-PGF domain-containing protein [Methanofollis formosanus]|uniref:PGF-pre-PGF domain-containing protein n=1 Tax=Methanofollis formosanus TaxID=299308 RepID=A0A8G1A2F9_9EURY|nr:zinc ABC transporter substrate-binding protein [Methanofollis formosanus]QYZ79330.1 PGF-pre-PGF domain-containing protein [Methanofollis formosanus]